MVRFKNIGFHSFYLFFIGQKNEYQKLVPIIRKDINHFIQG